MTSCPRQGIYSLMNQSCPVPSCCRGTGEGLSSFPTAMLHPLTAAELHRNDTKLQKEVNKALKFHLLLTTKMFKNCISFLPFET